jgi:hypothetical protein
MLSLFEVFRGKLVQSILAWISTEPRRCSPGFLYFGDSLRTVPWEGFER